MNVTTHPEALDEIEDAMDWLSRDSNWAPEQFLAEYDAHVAKIKARPDSYRKVHREFRRLNLNRFRHAIIYRLRGNDIYIIAVMHEKRHPDYWKHRVGDDA